MEENEQTEAAPAAPDDAAPEEEGTAEQLPADQEAAAAEAQPTAEAQTATDEPTPAEEPAPEPAGPTRRSRKERIGVVISDKMDKSILVGIERQIKHPMYGKYIKKSTKLMAHDETNDANEGDTVRLMETRPLSKRKRWRLVEVIARAK